MVNANLIKMRWMYIGFFVILAVPSGLLSYKAYDQLHYKALHQSQTEANRLLGQIDDLLSYAVEKESARADADYTFLVLAGGKNGIVQRSELSKYPVESELPGVLGYFQVDERGQFSSPLLPRDARLNSEKQSIYGVSADELQLRLALENNIKHILAENQLVVTVSNTNAAALSEIKAESDDNASNPKVGNAQTSSSYPSTPLIEAGSYFDSEPDSDSESDSVIDVSDYEQDKILKKADTERQRAQQKFQQLADLDKQRRQNKFKSHRAKQAQQSIKADEFKKKNSRKTPAYSKPSKLSEKVQVTGSRLSKKRVEKHYQPNLKLESGGVKELKERAESAPSSQLSQNLLSGNDFQISLFESEIEPLRVNMLKSGHLVIFRQVWRNKKRVIQGILLSTDEFLALTVKKLFSSSPLNQTADLQVIYGNRIIKQFSLTHDYNLGAIQRQSLLDEGWGRTLSEPFGQFKLSFELRELPKNIGLEFIIALALGLLSILLAGTYALYRLSCRQMRLAQKQQDFVSSISHELKTPLTSIRMYGEILLQGWVSEEKKQTYYHYIFDEAERLSRLIANVLQISKVSRNRLELDLKPVTLQSLVNLAKSKVDSQLNQTGFSLNIVMSRELVDRQLLVDEDAFTQIIINLVDNAVKYSSKSDNKTIDLNIYDNAGTQIIIAIRDYGPGIRKSSLPHIFDLFYRSGSELTRETQGTGIGLALVKELANAMSAKIQVCNRKPGFEVQIKFS